jgi:hypothetical protein
MPPKRRTKKQVLDSDDDDTNEISKRNPDTERPEDMDVDVDIDGGASPSPTMPAPLASNSGSRGRKRRRAQKTAQMSEDDVHISSMEEEDFNDDDEMSALATEDEDGEDDESKRLKGRGKGGKGGKQSTKNSAKRGNTTKAQATTQPLPPLASVSVESAHEPPAQDESKQPPLKKPKLPPIRKTKGPQPGGLSVSVSGPSTPASLKAAAKGSATPDPLITPTVARKPIGKGASNTAPDFDLRNKDVYESLFNTVCCKNMLMSRFCS